MLKDIIIEGCDRLGKDSLISGLIDELGFFQELHYQKPRLVKRYRNDAVERLVGSERFAVDSVKASQEADMLARRSYQVESFFNMFNLLSSPVRFILNRSHLGEAVYAHRYRGYDGSYVFTMEEQMRGVGSKFADTTLLVLLTTSDFSIVTDDGLSFDFSKKEEEQEDFKQAFEKTIINHKIMIDVSDGNGKYRQPSSILEEVISAYRGA